MNNFQKGCLSIPQIIFFNISRPDSVRSCHGSKKLDFCQKGNYLIMKHFWSIAFEWSLFIYFYLLQFLDIICGNNLIRAFFLKDSKWKINIIFFLNFRRVKKKERCWQKYWVKTKCPKYSKLPIARFGFGRFGLDWSTMTKWGITLGIQLTMLPTLRHGLFWTRTINRVRSFNND